MQLLLHDDYITAFQRMPISALPLVRKQCAFLNEEIDAVMVWAWIFVRPMYLGAEVTKHWIFKKDEIKASAATSEQLWDEGKPYAAG